jgi:serine/threonine protein phosphatase 1
MQNKTYVIGDIHGGLKALLQVLERAPFRKTDTLIFLGDYVDGWSESPQVLDFLMDFRKSQNCIFIKGNHDDLLLNYLKSGSYHQEWFVHGGKSTLEAYQSYNESQIETHIEFLESLQGHFLDAKNRLFLHAGFTNMKGVDFEFFKKLFYWDRTLWETAVSLNPLLDKNDPAYPDRLKIYNEIYIGHTPTTRLGSTLPMHKACVWNIDTGAAFKGPVTILDCETKEFWQSDPLPSLYPDETGRN